MGYIDNCFIYRQSTLNQRALENIHAGASYVYGTTF